MKMKVKGKSSMSQKLKSACVTDRNEINATYCLIQSTEKIGTGLADGNALGANNS